MIESVKKKRKVSKKTKKSWRKHVDTKDVDSFLESTRLEERLGAPFVERSNQELFVVDIKPETVEGIVESKIERRAPLRNVQPRCLASLRSHTAVPDPIAKRNRVRTPEERKNPITKHLEADGKLSGRLKLKEQIAAKNKEFADAKRVTRPKRGQFDVDIWSDEKKVLPEIDSQWLTPDALRHTLANKGMKKKRIPKSIHEKPSVLPSVDVPHPGTSYNPSYEDHRSLLSEVAQMELRLIKEETHLNRVTNKMFKKVSHAQKNEDWLRESSEGLPLKQGRKGESEKIVDDVEDSVVGSANPPAKNHKKTLVQRRKQKEQRRLALRVKHAKVEKKKISDIYKLKVIKKHLASKKEKEESLREMRRRVRERKAIAPKTLSRIKFEPMEPVFKLGEELTGNLRNAEPSTSLLKDRYKSLQQRNMVAPATRVL